MKSIFGLSIPALLFAVFGVSACVHQPPMEECPLEGVDSSPIAVCDPDVIYFEKDVLPIFETKCAKGPCHSDSSAKDGVILEDFASVHSTVEIKPCNPSDSELLKVLYENGDDRMPPAGEKQLTADEIRILEKWIQQGAQNFICQNACDTLIFTFSGSVQGIVKQRCEGCHSGTNPQGGILLTNYSEISTIVSSGQMMGVLTANGYKQMPPTRPLIDCEVTTIRKWVDAGALNN